MKTYLYSYLHRGARYGFEIVADDIHEADDRLRSIKFGEVQYDGILGVKIHEREMIGCAWGFCLGVTFACALWVLL